jgi:ribonuclease BN (tRNA processing enzyme)
MHVHFLGSGDAFGSGGRFNTCFLVARDAASFLIDCGASTLIAMRRSNIDPNSIRTIFISHLHGDHFGGLPFFILEAQFYSRRTEPLTVVGPPGLAARLKEAMEVFFPDSSGAKRKFETEKIEIAPGETRDVNGIEVSAVEVRHACGAPPLALRIACDGKTIAYSGDTEWTTVLADVGRGADLFIIEALTFEKKIPQHLDYASARANAHAIGAKRMILTHLGPDMLANADRAEHEIAHDGLIVDL